MDKRYQVFVSSTFADLVDERRAVMQTLMKMPCIPAGMELFPASDESQLVYIKRIIDNCDYYLLIVGGRYGSQTKDGISFTEKEYEYAVDRRLHVIALLHEDPSTIPLGKSEGDPAIRERLRAFRERISKDRLVQHWKSAADLPGLVALSMQTAMSDHPAIGWIRADRAANEDVLGEINLLRKENELLKQEVAKYEAPLQIGNLASLDEPFDLRASFKERISDRVRTPLDTRRKTWKQLFSFIAPKLAEHPNEDTLSREIAKNIWGEYSFIAVHEGDMETLRTQFEVLGLITVHSADTRGGGRALFWYATEKGRALGLHLRAVRTATPTANV